MSHRRVYLLTTESKDIFFNGGDVSSCSYRHNEHIWPYFAILFLDFSHFVPFPSPSPLYFFFLFLLFPLFLLIFFSSFVYCLLLIPYDYIFSAFIVFNILEEICAVF